MGYGGKLTVVVLIVVLVCELALDEAVGQER